MFMLYKTPKELVLLNSAFHDEQKLQEEIVSFAIFSKHSLKVTFSVNPSLYCVLYYFLTCLQSMINFAINKLFLKFLHLYLDLL